MSHQLWLAGVPVVGDRKLEPSDDDRLNLISRTIRENIAVTVGVAALSVVGLALVSAMSFAVGWLGPILLSITSGLIRLLPTRQLHSPRTLLRLQRDRRERAVYICQEDEVVLEVLKHSRIVWSRFGLPALDVSVVHSRLTAQVPRHAEMAANFVRPLETTTEYHAHRRALSDDERAELDAYAPMPSLPIMIAAIISSVWCLISITYFVRGVFGTLLPGAVFLALAIWSSRRSILAIASRRKIAGDLEAGYVVIIRSEKSGVLLQPVEILPSSLIIWTEGGVVARWRRHFQAP